MWWASKEAHSFIMKGQSKLHSWLEAWVNILIGYSVNFTANMFILPMIGFNITLTQNFFIGWIYTIISLARQFVIRRYFNKWMVAIHLRESYNADK